MTSAYFRPYGRPYRLLGRGRGVLRQPNGVWRMPSFLGGKSRGAFGQLAFFLAGNRMTIVAFEKEVSLAKRIVRQYWSFKLEKRTCNSGIYKCSLEYFALLSQFHSRGRTHDAGSVTRIAFKYKLTGFRINFFKNDFSVHYLCLFFLTVGQSTGQASLQWLVLFTAKITAKNCFQFWLWVHLFVPEIYFGPKSFRTIFEKRTPVYSVAVPLFK